MTEETQPQKSGTKAILTCANFIGKFEQRQNNVILILPSFHLFQIFSTDLLFPSNLYRPKAQSRNLSKDVEVKLKNSKYSSPEFKNCQRRTQVKEDILSK